VISPWWAAFSPAETVVSCGSGEHTVRWQDGALHAVEHPDTEGELVLAALGSDVAPCLDLIGAWERHCDDLVVLSLGPRSAGDLLTITTADIDDLEARQHPPGWRRRRTGLGKYGTSRGGGAFTSGRVSGPALPAGRVGIGGASARLVQDGDPGRHELLRLLTLSTPFQLRLSGAVAHAWSALGLDAARADRAQPALTAALTGRVAPAAARWLCLELTQIQVALEAGPGGGAIELDDGPDGARLTVALPVSWLARVWAPGLAIVDGYFTIRVQHAAWPAARILALSEPGRDPVELTVRHEGDRWRVVRR
jgi:hypothetical protein